MSSTGPIHVEAFSVPTEVLSWPDGAPYLHSDIDPTEVMHAVRATAPGGAVPAIGLVRSPSVGRDRPWITAMGDAPAVVAVVTSLLDRSGDIAHGGLVAGATVPAATKELLSSALARRADPVSWGAHDQGAPWDWWWTDSVTEPQPPLHSVEWLDTRDPVTLEAIRSLLAVASPTHWAPPEHPDTRRWAGIRTAEGSLVACAVETRRISRRPHLASVATHPDHRGQGMGAAVTGWITARLLEEGAPLVSLGMYAHNDAARRVYDRLGYTCACSWFSSGFASIPASLRC